MVDLGCWPGGWLQVAAEAVGPAGRVVGVDLAAIEPPLEFANVIAFQGDLAEARVLAAHSRRRSAARPTSCSRDAAPKLTGVRDADRAHEGALLEAVERALPRLLRPGGDALIKILESPEAQAVEKRLRTRFTRAKSFEPAASRPGTRERYLLAFGFRGSPRRGRR